MLASQHIHYIGHVRSHPLLLTVRSFVGFVRSFLGLRYQCRMCSRVWMFLVCWKNEIREMKGNRRGGELGSTTRDASIYMKKEGSPSSLSSSPSLISCRAWFVCNRKRKRYGSQGLSSGGARWVKDSDGRVRHSIPRSNTTGRHSRFCGCFTHSLAVSKR